MYFACGYNTLRDPDLRPAPWVTWRHPVSGRRADSYDPLPSLTPLLQHPVFQSSFGLTSRVYYRLRSHPHPMYGQASVCQAAEEE